MYGKKIYIPVSEDRDACFREYLHRKETVLTNITRDVPPEVDIMDINDLLSKLIFDKCPTNEFFIEQRWPLDWMYSHVEPHGLIFKINRQPLAGLSDEIIQRDRDYWRNSLTPKIGVWLTQETTVQTVAAFAKKTFSQRDFNGFAGDPGFVQNGYTCRMFSRERAAIAGLYVWRAKHAKDDSEKKRLAGEADFAFRQAWALCPYAYEAALSYVNFLMSQNRLDDALLVAKTMAAMPQLKDDEFVKGLPDEVRQYFKQHPPPPYAN